MNSEKHTISILVENEFGVLARVAGMFAGRGFNIEALTVAPTHNPRLSRMTLVTQGNPQIIEQIVKQLNRLVDVLDVLDVSNQDCFSLELLLIKFKVEPSAKTIFEKLAETSGGKIVDIQDDCYILQFLHSYEQSDLMLQNFRDYSIVEMIRTGNIAMQKGLRHLSAEAS